MAQNSTWEPSDITNTGAGEGDAPKRRGRIPQSAWPQILERHRAGATLSAIAREFDCTPSAISYIVRKAEAAGTLPGAAGDAAAPPPEATEQGEPQPERQPQPGQEATAQPGGEAAPRMPEPPSAAEAQPEPARVEVTQPEAPRAEMPGVEMPRPEGTKAEAPRGEPPRPERPRASQPRPEGPVADRPRMELGSKPARPTLRVAEPRPEPAPQPMADAASPSPPQPASAGATAAGTAPAGSRGGAEPVDAVEARLRDTARACLLAYRGWRQQPGEATIQSLSETVHELRKALARIEIDMSATRREEQALRPIPIPAHRAARRPNGTR
jgi:transposase-like protein